MITESGLTWAQDALFWIPTEPLVIPCGLPASYFPELGLFYSYILHVFVGFSWKLGLARGACGYDASIRTPYNRFEYPEKMACIYVLEDTPRVLLPPLPGPYLAHRPAGTGRRLHSSNTPSRACNPHMPFCLYPGFT